MSNVVQLPARVKQINSKSIAKVLYLHGTVDHLSDAVQTAKQVERKFEKHQPVPDDAA